MPPILRIVETADALIAAAASTAGRRDLSGFDYDGAMRRARALVTTCASTAQQSEDAHEAMLGGGRNTGLHGLRFFTPPIREWAHTGFLGRAGRACYYLLETRMDARREPTHSLALASHYPPVSHPTAA
jgi:hypothetical protein